METELLEEILDTMIEIKESLNEIKKTYLKLLCLLKNLVKQLI